MRTTVRLEDASMRELKRLASKEGVSLTQLLNRVVKLGLRAMSGKKAKPQKRFRQKTYDMGEARFPVDKALAFAAQLEDEETIRKLALGK